MVAGRGGCSTFTWLINEALYVTSQVSGMLSGLTVTAARCGALEPVAAKGTGNRTLCRDIRGLNAKRVSQCDNGGALEPVNVSGQGIQPFAGRYLVSLLCIE